MANFKLPELQQWLPIVDAMGKPMANFVRWWNIDVVGTIERQEIRQDATDASLQEQIDRINRILAGTEQFTAVNVGGTIVAENAGLADDIVTTPTVSSNAITNEMASSDVAIRNLTGTTDFLVETVSYTSTGRPIEVKANFFLTIKHPDPGDVSVRIWIERTGAGSPIFDQTIDAVGGDYLLGWMTPIVVEDPPPAAGAYTWNLYVSLSNNDSDIENIRGSFLNVREYKR